MEIRQLRQFLVLAEELHFGNAAKRLNMAQPPLSQSIRRLEKTVGTKLLSRSSRRVELTAPGSAFAQEVSKALLQLDFALDLARRVSVGEITKLNVGFVSSALFHALPTAIRRFRDLDASVSLRLEERSSQLQITGLLDGSIDIGFLHPLKQKLAGLSSIVIEVSRPKAAIPVDWPLAKRTAIKFAELADMPFVTLPYAHSPAHHMAFVAACRQAGFTPQVSQEASQTQTILSLVGAGLGVALASASAAAAGVAGVSFVTISDVPASLNLEIVAAWSPKRETPELLRFIGILEECSAV